MNKKQKISEMELSILGVIVNFTTKLSLLLSNIFGWFYTLIIGIGMFFIPIKDLILVLTCLVLLDMLLGIIINRKHILSSKLRNTLVKFFFYLILIGGTFAFENVIGIDILYKIVFAVISAVELLSIIANMTILKPDLRFLKLFKSLLLGEIAKKLDVSKEDVEEVLYNKKNSTLPGIKDNVEKTSD